jgi:hypothetical protein
VTRPKYARVSDRTQACDVDGEWVPVSDKITYVVAPDGGAHVCAPDQIGHKGLLFYVIRRTELMPAVTASAQVAPQARP